MNVGIGTTTPSEQLEVAGRFRADRMYADVANGTPPLKIDSMTKVDNLNVDRLDNLSSEDFRLEADLIELADLAADSVDSSKVVDDSLTNDDLGPNSVRFSELAPDSVASVHVQPDSLSFADLAPGSVGTSELQGDAVNTFKIVNGTIINADVSIGAAIQGTKIVPDFGDRLVDEN